jgi:hypothetical protein
MIDLLTGRPAAAPRGVIFTRLPVSPSRPPRRRRAHGVTREHSASFGLPMLPSSGEGSEGGPPVVPGPSAARRRGAATALPGTRLHCSPRFSHHLGFLPIFLPQSRPPTGRAARNPLHGRGFASTLRDRWTGPSKLVMRVRSPSSALLIPALVSDTFRFISRVSQDARLGPRARFTPPRRPVRASVTCMPSSRTGSRSLSPALAGRRADSW